MSRKGKTVQIAHTDHRGSGRYYKRITKRLRRRLWRQRGEDAPVKRRHLTDWFWD